MRFVDTNVLLYAISTAPDEQAKMRIARSIMDCEDLALSVQVLEEFYVQSTRKSKSFGISHDQACLLIESFLRFPVKEMTVSLVKASIEAKARFEISFWDAAIIEAARALKCSVVLSEDLNAGQDYGGIRIENPFAA